VGGVVDEIHSRKKEVRRVVRDRLNALSGPELQQKSERIARTLFGTPWWAEAQWVFAYIAMPSEVETRPIIVRAYRDRKHVAIPRIEGDELVFYRYDGSTHELLPNQFGILEPDPGWAVVDPCRLVLEWPEPAGSRPLLILAPGMSFDRSRNRLGRGKGFYDRLLAAVRCAPVGFSVVGLAYSEQLIGDIPVHDHDEQLDGVVTDLEVIT
jgi:5-formyltetrahydrofolate cyclo-ligase